MNYETTGGGGYVYGMQTQQHSGGMALEPMECKTVLWFPTSVMAQAGSHGVSVIGKAGTHGVSVTACYCGSKSSPSILREEEDCSLSSTHKHTSGRLMHTHTHRSQQWCYYHGDLGYDLFLWSQLTKCCHGNEKWCAYSLLSPTNL